jgi:uncharacterized membrane protein YgcG
MKMMLVALVMVLSFGSDSFAQDCNVLVVDQAGILGSGISSLERAIGELKEATGADMRLRVLASHDSLKRYIAEQRSLCPDWREGSARRGNVIVMAFAMQERKSELDYGQDWTAAIGNNQWGSIQHSVVTPRFRNKDFSGGIEAGIGAISTRIKAFQNPPAQSPITSPPVTQVVYTQPPTPMDWSWLLYTILIALGLVASVLTGKALLNVRHERSRRRLAQHKAINARTVCSNLVNIFEELVEDAKNGLVSVSADLSPEECKRRQEEVELLHKQGKIQITAFSDLADGLNDPTRPGLSVGQYEEIASQYSAISSKLAGARGELEDILSAPTTKAVQLGRLKDLNAVVQRFGTSALTEAHAIFDRISSEYAEVCWVSIKGNGTEATNRCMLARECADRVPNSLSAGDWAGVDEALTKGEKAIERARSMIHSITELAKSLDVARRDSAQDIASAEKDLREAIVYVTQYRQEIDDNLTDDLEKAIPLLDAAKAELGNHKPDYFQVIKLAKKAHENIDSIMASARTKKEAVDRERQKAAAALRDAKSRVSKAREYIDDHRSDVKKKAKTELEQAQEQLARAEATTDLATIIILAQESESLAKSSYNHAVDDFRVADDARTPPPVSGGYGGSSGSSWSSSSSSGGGHSQSSWGSSWSSGDSGGSFSSSFDSGGGGGSDSGSW